MNKQVEVTAKQMFINLGYGYNEDESYIYLYKMTSFGNYREIIFYKKQGVLTVKNNSKLPNPMTLNIDDLEAMLVQAKELDW